MGFKDIIGKVRKAILCCGDSRRKESMEIGLPTDVRRGAWSMPGLSKEQDALIREKASSDAHLISLTSFPPLDTSTSNPTNNHTQSPCSAPSSPAHSFPPSLSSSRSPSATLLNSASSNLPTSLPTPPRREFSDSMVPAKVPASAHADTGAGAGGRMMKGFWERTRRLSSTLTHGSSPPQAKSHGHGNGRYHSVRGGGVGKKAGAEEDEGVVLLNLDLAFKEKGGDSDRGSARSAEGFEVQDCVGGAQEGGEPGVASVEEKNGSEIKSVEDPFASKTSIGGARTSSDDGGSMIGAGQRPVGERMPLVQAS